MENYKKLHPEFKDPTKFNEFYKNLSITEQKTLKNLMIPYVEESRKFSEFIIKNKNSLEKLKLNKNKNNAKKVGDIIIKIVKNYPQFFYCEKRINALLGTQHPWYTIVHLIDDYIVESEGKNPNEYPSHYVEDTIRKQIVKNCKLNGRKRRENYTKSMSLFSRILFFKLGGIIESDMQVKKYLWEAKGMIHPCCEKCGSEHFIIHHIDGNHYNNSINNVIYVCPNHHKEFHDKEKEGKNV